MNSPINTNDPNLLKAHNRPKIAQWLNEAMLQATDLKAFCQDHLFWLNHAQNELIKLNCRQGAPANPAFNEWLNHLAHQRTDDLLQGLNTLPLRDSIALFKHLKKQPDTPTPFLHNFSVGVMKLFVLDEGKTINDNKAKLADEKINQLAKKNKELGAYLRMLAPVVNNKPVFHPHELLEAYPQLGNQLMDCLDVPKLSFRQKDTVLQFSYQNEVRLPFQVARACVAHENELHQRLSAVVKPIAHSKTPFNIQAEQLMTFCKNFNHLTNSTPEDVLYQLMDEQRKDLKQSLNRHEKDLKHSTNAHFKKIFGSILEPVKKQYEAVDKVIKACQKWEEAELARQKALEQTQKQEKAIKQTLPQAPKLCMG